MPAELDEVERRIMQLEIEREALKKETDKPSKERLQKLEKELADLKEQKSQLTSHWQQEKETILAGRKLKEELEQVRIEIDRAQRGGDYAKASELQYGRSAGARAADQGRRGAAHHAPAGAADVEGRSRRGGYRRRRQPLDAHPGEPPDGGRDPEAPPDGSRGSTTASSDRRKPFRPSPTRFDARGPGCRTPTALSAASSSSARPGSARPSWRVPSPSSCSMTSTRWSASTCRSTRRSTPSRA